MQLDAQSPVSVPTVSEAPVAPVPVASAGLARFIPLASTLAVMAVSAVANIVTINGYRTGQVSDLYPTGFTPAGWVFSIWSVIYLGLLAHSLGQIVGSPGVRRRGAPLRPAFVVSAAANIAWVFAWHHRLIGVSFALMLVVLATLVIIHRDLRKQIPPTRVQRLLVDVPFSLYFGWITTATIANFGALMTSRGGYPFQLTMDQWALVSVIAAIAVYVAMGVATRDSVYCAVFVWASLGIFLKPDGISTPVRIAAITGTSIVLLLVIALLVEGAAAPSSSSGALSEPLEQPS